MIDRDWVRHCLTGPIASIRPPFHANGDLDVEALRRCVDFNIEAGSRTMLITAGDSHLFALSEHELTELHRIVVDQTAGRAMVVGADCQYATAQACEFADWCRGNGVDVLMVLPPDWGKSLTPATLAAHYRVVGEHLPVMVVTNLFIPRGEAFARQTISLTLEQAPNVVALKDDMCGTFARWAGKTCRERWAVFSGGQKQNHLNMHPYGADGYLATFVTFKPEVSRGYWQAIEANDLTAAAAIVHDLDAPFFELIGGLPGGFDAGIHGVLEIMGLAGRWRRPPYHSLTDAELDRLRDGLERLGII